MSKSVKLANMHCKHQWFNPWGGGLRKRVKIKYPAALGSPKGWYKSKWQHNPYRHRDPPKWKDIKVAA